MAFGLLSGTSGIQPDFLSRLEQLRRALPNNLGAQIGVRSGYRSPEHQADLFRRAVAKYGSVAAARKWVAPPGHSQHNRGFAVDLSYGSPEAMRAAHQYAGQFGLTFPMSYENWHIEPVGARGGRGASGGQAVNLTGALPATGGATPPPATPTSTVADILSGAAGSGGGGGSGIPRISAGGGGGGAGTLVGDFSAPSFDLQTTPVGEPPAPDQAAATTMPDLSPLAGLFGLPTIGQPGGELPPDAMAGFVPGQAKQPLKRLGI